MDNDVVVKVGSDEVRPLVFTPDTINKFWERAKQFPTIYGREILTIQDFMDTFFTQFGNTLQPNGLFWVFNDFVGVFYLTEIREDHGILVDANAHYTFFDRRHHKRVPIVKEMLKFWFTKYGFQRLSANIPNYATTQVRHFAQECGMAYEGKRRKAAKFKDQWWDVNLYGILKSEVLNGRSD